jgi:outer membrane protein
MKRITTILVAVLAVTGVATSAFAQKIGVIDTKTVLESMPEVAAANQKLQAMQKNWQDSLQLMQTAMQSKADAYKKVLDSMTPERKDQANAELMQMNDAMMKFKDQKFGQTGDLAQAQQTMFAPIFDKIKAVIATIGKKDKLAVVLDKTATFYSEGAEDISLKAIDELKAANSSAK